MELPRRSFLKASGAGLGAAALMNSSAGASQSSAPNVIVIMDDQHRADVSARAGFELDTTPLTDQLAGDGVWFDRAYTTSPLCSPARTSMLTGRWPSAHRVRENPGAQSAVFDADLPGVLREAGYVTALVGKNHTYLQDHDLDYTELYGHTGALHDRTTAEQRAFDTWLRNLRHRTATEPTPFPLELQCPHRIVSGAQRWIDSVRQQRPFFLWMSFPEPHNPYQVPEPYFSLFPPDDLPPTRHGVGSLERKTYPWRYLRLLGETGDPEYADSIPRARSNYFGMLRLIDDQLQRFVGFLEQRRLLDNTLVFIVSDHGDYVGEHGLLRKGAGVPELLTRVPLIAHGPGIASHRGPHPAHVSLADMFPTICEAIGTPLPQGVQGRSLWPMLTGNHYPDDEFTSAYVEQGIGGLPYTPSDVGQPLPGLGGADGWSNFDELNEVTMSGQLRAVSCDEWKLVSDVLGENRLYHLPTDPGEMRDLSGQTRHTEVHARLLRELNAWMIRAEDPLPVPAEGYPRKRDPRNYVSPYRNR